MVRKLTFFVVLIILAAPVFAGKICYVDGKSGNDSNDGLSLQIAWKTINKATTSVAAGDTVYIRGGTYTENDGNAVLRTYSSGTPGNYITFQNFNDEEVIFKDRYIGIFLGHNYVRVIGFKLDNGNQDITSMHWGVRGAGTHHNVIQNLTIKYLTRTLGSRGIWLQEDTSYYHVVDNDIQYVGCPQPPYPDDEGEGIWADGHHHLIERNYTDYCGHNGISVGGQYHIVRNNVLRGSWGRVAGTATIGSPQNHHCVWEDNIIYESHLGDGVIPNPGFQLQQSYTIFRRNLIYDSVGSGMLIYATNTYQTSYAKIYNNVFYDNGKEQNIYYSHAIYMVTADAESNMTGHQIKNNICYKNYSDGIAYYIYATPTRHFISNNHWNLDGDPAFQNEGGYDFHLLWGSPCIDKGAFLTNTTQLGAGNQIPVENSGYFIDGFGITDGDLIQLEGQTQKARIIKIDYENNIITLNKCLTWRKAQGISLYYSGLAPDIGRYEFKFGFKYFLNLLRQILTIHSPPA